MERLEVNDTPLSSFTNTHIILRGDVCIFIGTIIMNETETLTPLVNEVLSDHITGLPVWVNAVVQIVNCDCDDVL
jgi:hypothetical protein